MIFRAIVTVAFVWFVWPHEPDIGLGRPAVASEIPAIARIRGVMLDKIDKARADIELARGQHQP